MFRLRFGFAFSGLQSRRMSSVCLRIVALSLLVGALHGPTAAAQSVAGAFDNPHRLSADQATQLRSYIHSAWQTLARSQSDCKFLIDPKLTTKPVLYVPIDIDGSVQQIESKCNVRVVKLPRAIQRFGEVKVSELDPPGLLYLPNPYVVPGGRFNEMYGWDSYFIIRGLLLDGELNMARNMIENFFFEIEHYGSILNANRTYYLTRSQPPFITSMIMAYYQARSAQGTSAEQKQWLQRAYEYAQRDYKLWTNEPKLAGTTGLSRYFDLGEGPVPEMGDDPTYYSDVASSLLTMRDPDGYLASGEIGEPAQVGPLFSFELCAKEPATQQHCSSPRAVALSEEFYKGDRAMRESGFDPSFRFGLYSGSTHHYTPVCLNSLLWKAEQDLAQMAEMLGRNEDAARWKQLGEKRKAAMNKYFWNVQAGMFFDYDFMAGRQSSYYYASAFYPLWAGWATLEQAKALAQNLSHFEHPGGLAMSDRVTGMQWDLPYGWAPLQLLAVEGLHRYGFSRDAQRLSEEFVSDVYDNFQRDRTIREKYNVVTRSTEAAVAAGYKTNVVGFGWTNGVTLVFLDQLQAQR